MWYYCKIEYIHLDELIRTIFELRIKIETNTRKKTSDFFLLISKFPHQLIQQNTENESASTDMQKLNNNKIENLNKKCFDIIFDEAKAKTIKTVF